MAKHTLNLVLACLAAWATGALAATEPAKPTSGEAPIAIEQIWTANGGSVGFRFNRELLSAFKIELLDERAAVHTSSRGFTDFRLREQDGIQFDAPHGKFEKFIGGRLQAAGGFDLLVGGQRLSFQDFSLRPSKRDPLVLELQDRDGRAWFYIDRLMYGLDRDANVLVVRTMDLRIGAELAKLIAVDRHAQGMAIADLRLLSHVRARTKLDPVPDSCGAPNWPGTGGYVADVLLESMAVQTMRCRQNINPLVNCDGPGSDDGEVVIAPSSTLRNSNILGVTAEVPWYEKFMSSPYPYPYTQNDQHPFLIWNLYRVDAAGRLEQIGRSGVKHAFYSTNVGCAEFCGNNNILGRGCGDTYGTTNNDDPFALGPRSEMVPARGQWGRCHSIFDNNCDQSQDSPGNTAYSQRLITRESQIDPAVNAGAQYYFESWYIIRDDVNIYNTMGYKRIVPSWGGSIWNDGEIGAMVAGPVINLWVAPGSIGPNDRNTELSSSEGHARLAVKVTPLGGGNFRYDYALMNFDFARAVTVGAEAGHTFDVLSNKGFGSFSIPFPPGASASAIEFSDGDLNGLNDWTGTQGKTSLSWSAPAGAELNWGSMLRFSFVAARAPEDQNATLGVAQAGSPASYALATLSPNFDVIFQDGFE